jgi:hypothetical protein
VVALVVLAVAVPILNWKWRDHRVRAFCGDIRVGMTLSDLIELEKRHGIDGSYLFPFRRDTPPIRQQDTPDLSFIGGYPGDPDFLCSVQHDGVAVTAAKLVPE